MTMELNNIREHIDSIDREITRLFVERMETVAQVAASKKSTGKAIRDRARERTIINRVTEQAGETYAPYVKDLYKLLFELSCNYQSTLMGHTSALSAQLIDACAQYAGKRLPNRAPEPRSGDKVPLGYGRLTPPPAALPCGPPVSFADSPL